jgi:hypothetical protein
MLALTVTTLLGRKTRRIERKPQRDHDRGRDAGDGNGAAGPERTMASTRSSSEPTSAIAAGMN